MTPGEIEWASLISRQNTFRSLLETTDYIYLRFQYGSRNYNTRETTYSSFVLPRLKVRFPGMGSGVPMVYLCLKGYDYEGRSVLVMYRMHWPSSLVEPGVRLYNPRSPGIKIRFPIDSGRYAKRPRSRNANINRWIQPARVGSARLNIWLPISLSRSTQLAGITKQVASSLLAQAKGRYFGTMAKPRQRSAARNTNGSVFGNFPFSFSRTQPEVNSSGFMSIETSYRGASHNVIPDYRERVSKGKPLPVLPYDLDVRKTTPGQAWQKIEAVSDGTVVFDAMPLIGGFISVPTPPLSFSATCNDKALRKLSSNTGIQVSNAAVTLIQWKQLNSLINGNTGKLIRALWNLKKGRLRDAEQILFWRTPPRYKKGYGLSATNTVASNWLALQYGWKPLLSDIEGGMLSLSQYIAKDPTVIAVRGSASERRLTTSPIMGPLKWSLATVSPYTCGNTETLMEYKCQYGLAYALEDAQKAYLAQTGFLNPVNLAWELIPFSFVADWFLPIGPYLEGFNTFKGLRFVEGFKSTLVRETTLCTVRDSRLAGSGAQVVSVTCNGQGIRKRAKFKRELLTEFPMPEPPSFRNPFTATRALNAIALVVSAFRH